MQTETIDVAGLPEQDVLKVRRFVASLRNPATKGTWEPLCEAEWAAEWNAFKASHTHVTGVADDSRESIYSDDRP